jgi:hypothetical protein
MTEPTIGLSAGESKAEGGEVLSGDIIQQFQGPAPDIEDSGAFFRLVR